MRQLDPKHVHDVHLNMSRKAIPIDCSYHTNEVFVPGMLEVTADFRCHRNAVGAPLFVGETVGFYLPGYECDTAGPGAKWYSGVVSRLKFDHCSMVYDVDLVNVECQEDKRRCKLPTKGRDAKMKKFYVGKQDVQLSAWAKETEAEAIEHAKELVRQTGKEQVVVKVIAVVGREEPPIKVKRVK